MNKERFEELSEALRQAKAVRRGEAAPSRVWSVTRGSNGQLHRRQLDPKRVSARTAGGVGKDHCGHADAVAAVAKQICGTARHFRQDAAQLGTGAAQADGRGAGAVARGVAASRSGFGRSDGVKKEAATDK